MEKDFARYDQSDLISTLAGLQILPENHLKTIRLEVATRIASSIKHSGTQRVDIHTLINLLNFHLPSNGNIGIMEDPPENLFTENIVFHGGNYIVYPGITEHGSQVLRLLFHTIFHNNKLPTNFVNEIMEASLILLTLSNEVAKRIGHHRYMDSSDTFQKDFNYPGEDQTIEFKRAVTFHKMQINVYLKALGIHSSAIIPFINIVGSDNLNEIDPLKNPLFIRPLVDVGDKVIVALPGSITLALRHFILVTSKKYGVTEIIAESYREISWMNVQEWLRLMSFEETGIELPTWETDLPVKEGTYKIDIDKLAYVQLIVDNANNYLDDEPTGSWELKDLSDILHERMVRITEWLTKENKHCAKVFILMCVEGIGRSFYLGIKQIPDNSDALLISGEDLEVIARLEDTDNLSLWKYVESKHLITLHTKMPLFSELDGFAFYLNCGHSFYFADDKKYSFLSIAVGFGLKLRIKVARMWDFHAAVRGNPPNIISVCRRYIDEDSIPIYVPEWAFARSFEQLVEGYYQPIWIEPKDNIGDIPSEFNEIYFQVTDMLSYWLWQLTPGIEEHLKSLGTLPISILFRLENPENWVNIGEKTNDTKGVPNIDYEINDRTILFTLPDNILPFLGGNDNHGERIILDTLLKSLGDLVYKNGIKPELNKAERTKLLNQYAPLGRKKKIFTIKQKNSSLNSHNLPRLRLIQNHNISLQLDNMVSELKGLNLKIGEINDKSKKTRICNAIVDVYLNRLKSALKEFYWESLIEQLIAQNEAILHRRAFTRLTIPTNIACFFGFQDRVDKEVDEFSKLQSSALATRTLIEIISAEPPKGSRALSLDAYDNVIAIAENLINWAMISEHVHLGIVDHEISILESGRVGTAKEDIEAIWNPFIKSKTIENIESAIARFDSQFDYTVKPLTINEEEFNAAFKSEFGLTMTQVMNFHSSLTLIGFELNMISPNLNLSAFKFRLNEVLEWDNNELDRAIDLFSLRPREKWEKAPAGFDAKEDIWPWRYNRRLSYLRRPIIMASESYDDPIVYWGPRHAEESANYLLSLITTGRYKIQADSSEDMKKLIGKIGNEAGKQFMYTVKIWFEENTEFQVFSEVPVRPGTILDSQIDLGDIDIMAISKDGMIFSVECKEVNFGRNPREIANEIERFIGVERVSNSWIQKHLRRHEWLNANIPIISKAFNMCCNHIQIFSLFMTSEEIPTTYIQDMPLPFVSFTKLRREGLKFLMELQK